MFVIASKKQLWRSEDRFSPDLRWNYLSLFLVCAINNKIDCYITNSLFALFPQEQSHGPMHITTQETQDVTNHLTPETFAKVRSSPTINWIIY